MASNQHRYTSTSDEPKKGYGDSYAESDDALTYYTVQQTRTPLQEISNCNLTLDQLSFLLHT